MFFGQHRTVEHASSSCAALFFGLISKTIWQRRQDFALSLPISTVSTKFRGISTCKFRAATPAESALTKSQDLKPFRISTYIKNQGEGEGTADDTRLYDGAVETPNGPERSGAGLREPAKAACWG